MWMDGEIGWGMLEVWATIVAEYGARGMVLSVINDCNDDRLSMVVLRLLEISSGV